MGKDIPNVNPAYADAEGIKQYFMKAKGIREPTSFISKMLQCSILRCVW